MKQIKKTEQTWPNASSENFELSYTVKSKFNRLVILPSYLFHGISIFDQELYKKHDRLTLNLFLDLFLIKSIK